MQKSRKAVNFGSEIKIFHMNVKGKFPRFLIIAVSSIVILVLYKEVHLIVAPLHLQRTLASFVMHLTVCLPIVAVLFLLHRPKDFFHQLGLDGNFIRYYSDLFIFIRVMI